MSLNKIISQLDHEFKCEHKSAGP